MEHERFVAAHGVLVDHRVRVLAAPGDHPELVPSRFRRLGLHLVELRQRHEPCLTALAHGVEVHGLILEGHRLESAVDVPTSASHVGATLRLVVRDPENIWMWTLRVLVESALDLPELLRYLHLPRAADLALVLEDEDAVLPHVLSDSVHDRLGQRFGAVKREVSDVRAKMREDGLDLVRARFVHGHCERGSWARSQGRAGARRWASNRNPACRTTGS
mmetsp:Transcript_113185/g.320362  ORF Transcript_113185/g.320362 Transcript_113185/m.320362 type:complete len:218 (+) Transcript_113185:341-994(+)